MESFRVSSCRSPIWSFLLLSLVVICHARVPSSSLPEDVSNSEGSNLVLPSSEDNIFASRWETLKSYSPFPTIKEIHDCEENYGIFPCSTTLGGNAFLLLVYGFCLLKAAQCLSEGSELLLTVLNPGIIGGLLLPVLGALPDALLILVSGLSASESEAQAQVLVGMGLLAGSTIMLLTLLWGTSLILGRCDLVDGRVGKVAKDKQLTKGWSLTETGVTTDQQTRVSSWIMMVTVLPYLVAQSPVIFGWSQNSGHIAVLIGCSMSLVGLASYCTYQVAFPWIQERWIYRARQRVHRSFALHRMSSFSHKNAFGSLQNPDGTANKEVLRQLFGEFDANHDNQLTKDEVRGLIVGLGIEKQGAIPDEELVQAWMTELDVNKNESMSEDEFILGMTKWMHSFDLPKKPKNSGPSNGSNDSDANDAPHLFYSAEHQRAAANLTAMLSDVSGEDDDDEDKEEHAPTRGQIIFRAVLYLLAGALIAAIMADPLVGAIGNFSECSGISPFFISFVATPLATNSSEAISSLLFALKKKKKNISMTYSQIYGGVTMNNTLCLGIFLAVVYYRGLTWDFSSEVLVILVATVVIGMLASVRVTFPFWMALISLALYPISVAMVAVLDEVYGWQ